MFHTDSNKRKRGVATWAGSSNFSKIEPKQTKTVSNWARGPASLDFTLIESMIAEARLTLPKLWIRTRAPLKWSSQASRVSWGRGIAKWPLGAGHVDVIEWGLHFGVSRYMYIRVWGG